MVCSNMICTAILIVIYCVTPALVLKLCKKVSFFGKIGPILILYILGVIIGNLPLINENTFEIKDSISSALVPLALPMMLFACPISLKDMKGLLKSLILGIVAVIVSIVLGYIIFGKHIGAQGPAIAALITGCETGGTINMASLQAMLNVPSETFVLLNSYDMIVCFLYFIFLLSIGIPLFRKILGNRSTTSSEKHEGHSINSSLMESMKSPYSLLKTKAGWSQVWKILLFVTICVGLAYALSLLFPESWFMPIFILGISTFALIAALLKPVKKLSLSYDIGLYFIYIFSITIASMADIESLHFKEGLSIFLFLFFVIFVSLFIQVILSKIMKVDADLMIASSVALINSPPFVPIVVSAMKNKKVMVPGITIGIIGFAVGNYLGFFIYNILL